MGKINLAHACPWVGYGKAPVFSNIKLDLKYFLGNKLPTYFAE